MRWDLIPEGKFNLKYRLGSQWDDDIDQDAGLSLSLIISRAIDTIVDPVIDSIENRLGILDTDKISIADYGALLFVELSRHSGTKVYIELPSWCKKYARSVNDLMVLMLSGSYHEYLDNFDSTAEWIFPINLLGAEALDLERFEMQENQQLQFDCSWILPSGIRKLNRIVYELSMRPDLTMYDSVARTIKEILRQAKEVEGMSV